MKELLALIRAITRRQAQTTDALLQLGNIQLDRSTYQLSSEKGTIRLANKEYQMLEMLLANPGQIISVEQFMDRIWGYDTDAELKVVWVYISYLRKKLASLDAQVQIRSTRGLGYSIMEIEEKQKDGRRGLSPEAAFDTHFFTVTLLSDGQIDQTDTVKIAAVSDEDASLLAQTLYEKGKNSGFFSCYRYRAVPGDSNTTMYIFVNSERELDTFYTFLFASIGISLVGLLLVFLLVVIFSRMDEASIPVGMLDFAISDAITDTAEPFIPLAAARGPNPVTFD